MMMPCAFQASSILRYSVILFCRFLAREVVGIDVLEPDEHARHAGALAFSMKFGILWHSVSTWIISRAECRPPPAA